MKPIIVIGAGMGGLTAAVHLARQGLEVLVLEARPSAGGLASAFEVDGFRFDAGPYILLDRPGLEWAFRALGLDLAERIELRRIDSIYKVTSREVTVGFHASAEQTAGDFERAWPGSGSQYLKYVDAMGRRYQRLRPMLERSHPGLGDFIKGGFWREARFLTRSLGSVLSATSLPLPVQEAIAIWTHVAGQSVDEAPSPMAFVSSLMHHAGCFYPLNGMRSIPEALVRAAHDAGVQFRFGAVVRKIRTATGSVRGVETEAGEFIEADVVVSNHSAVGTYVELVDDVRQRVRDRVNGLPLQSPGVCAYLAVKGIPQPPYLRFLLPETGRCRLLITPAVMDQALCRDGWSPARLLGPMDFAEAERRGEQGQREYLAELLAERWWRDGVDEFRVLATRVPAQWGAEFHLYRDSMNPVMTAQFMRAGRFAHRSPYVRGLYLVGSSTHPGQWVSFCAISGILAANCVTGDLAKC